jgi:hypothetical protein
VIGGDAADFVVVRGQGIHGGLSVLCYNGTPNWRPCVWNALGIGIPSARQIAQKNEERPQADWVALRRGEVKRDPAQVPHPFFDPLWRVVGEGQPQAAAPLSRSRGQKITPGLKATLSVSTAVRSSSEASCPSGSSTGADESPGTSFSRPLSCPLLEGRIARDE